MAAVRVVGAVLALAASGCAARPAGSLPPPFTARVVDVFQGQDPHPSPGLPPGAFVFVTVEFEGRARLDAMEYELRIGDASIGKSEINVPLEIHGIAAFDLTVRSPRVPAEEVVQKFKELRDARVVGTARGSDASGRAFELRFEARYHP